jgi:hypothetical protein
MISAAQSQLTEAQLAPARIANDISYAVAAKTLDAQRQEGATALKLLDSAMGAGTPQPGDPLVAKATGLGSLLDVMA